MKLLISILIPVGLGSLTGFLTSSDTQWFRDLAKPSFNPPSWVFAPVWSTLYIMMGIALYLIWKSNADARLKRTAITFFAVQLAFNIAWSFIFFNMQNLTFALIELILMWILIVATIYWFSKVSKVAAWLLVPYLCWVTFASVLTYSIWALN